MIIFIRHGQTTTNAQGLLVGRSDPDLTPYGERQAVALRASLTNVKEVWTSPLSRARRTAALALPDLEATVHDAFIEVDYGHWDGRPLHEVSGEQWRAFEHDHQVAFDGGESLAAVDERVGRALDELLDDAESYLHRNDEDLAIVSHVSPIKSATTWALGVEGSVAWRTRLDNASMTTIAVRSGTPALVRFNVVVPVSDLALKQRSPSAS